MVDLPAAESPTKMYLLLSWKSKFKFWNKGLSFLEYLYEILSSFILPNSTFLNICSLSFLSNPDLNFWIIGLTDLNSYQLKLIPLNSANIVPAKNWAPLMVPTGVKLCNISQPVCPKIIT